MKHLKLSFFIAGIAALSLTSCKPHVMCGDTASEKPSVISKRYRKALAERDSLCSLSKQQITELGSLNQNIEGLKKEYENLKSSSGNTVANLSGDLKNKQSELEKKERDLQEKEAKLKDLQGIINRQDSIMNALTNTVKKALLGFNPDELTVTMRDGKVYVSMSDKLLFKSGSPDVESKGKEALKKLAEVLNKNTDVSIAIEGHTDNVPIKTAQFKDNWDLSTARATNVVRLLTDEYGMDAKKLTAAGKGEFSPIADNSTTEGKAKNRRTEIVLSPKLDELMKAISFK
ncbi:MAG: OmpA/MotB domain protein [Bacteroidota bacterium]|jgi:chemotaxis protein MotB|nr:OmpA/MotB domain protein [Bacteroidota bacterium]